ncbi:MAG TPA: phage shock protein A, partial [Mesotoga sp.]|nr:phage shock protein A [Mesotoga sp.]
MEILDRFNDIIKSNVNALLDKMENPSKMIDQYLRELTEDLAEVKR